MIPDTWLPTWTVVTADSEPVAVTVMVTSPRSTATVRNWASSDVSRRWETYLKAIATRAAMTMRPNNQRRRDERRMAEGF